MSDDDKIHQIQSERTLRRAQQVAGELTNKLVELNQLLAILDPLADGEHRERYRRTA